MPKSIYAESTTTAPIGTERRRPEYHMRHATERETWGDWAVAAVAFALVCAGVAWFGGL